MANRRQTWPYQGAATSPPALTQSPDGLLNSGRSLAGPLRLGTAPGIGPTGERNGARESDFGMDRIGRRAVDAIGRQYPRADATLISRGRR